MNRAHRVLRAADHEPPAWKQLGALQVLHFCNDGFQAAFLLLLTVRAASLSLTPFHIGVITALHFLMGVIVSTQCGRHFHCRSGPQVLLVGMALYGVCFSLAGCTHHFLSLVAIYML